MSIYIVILRLVNFPCGRMLKRNAINAHTENLPSAFAEFCVQSHENGKTQVQLKRNCSTRAKV